jgi:ribosome maturation factor RimP
LVEPYVKDAGFDLVEVHSGREQSGWVVRLFIDSAPALRIPASRVSVASTIDGETVDDLGGDKVDDERGVDIEDLTGGTVSLEDCERVSRDVSAALDVADLIPHAYQLEVSSPGLDRPLRLESDFMRFAGREVRVRLTEGVEGRRNFSGLLRGAHDGLAEVECDGRVYHLPIEDVAKANLVPDWSKELKRSAS